SYPLYINSFVYNVGSPSQTPTPTPTPTVTPTVPPTPTPTSNPPLTPTPNSTATPAPKVSAVVSMSHSSVNFGTVKVGKSKSRVVKLTNTAKKKTGTAVTFDGASVTESNEISASTNCDGTVGPKQKCFVEIGFAPTVAGPVSATVTVNGNASNS